MSDNDYANVIFKKNNSAGNPLSDLISDYLLIELHKKYWQKIENNCQKKMDEFFRYYLTVKTLKTQRKGNARLYKEFKKYSKSKKEDVEDLLKDILLYSGYFKEIINAEVGNKKLSTALIFFNHIKLTTLHPLLLQIWHLWKNKKLTTDDLIKTIWTIESFVFALVIFNHPVIDKNNRIARIMNAIETDGNNNNLWDIVAGYMRYEVEKYKSIPINDNEKFYKGIKNRPYDELMNIMQLMWLLEYRLHKGKEMTDDVFVDKFELEHILPQTVKKESQWEKDFGEHGGEKHENNFPRLGNLTLSLKSHNISLSNRDFSKKKSMKGGYNASPMALDQFIKKCDIWTEKEIDDRTDFLAKEIMTMIMKGLPPSKYQPSK